MSKLAAAFIDTMIAIRELDRFIDNDEPMRHQVRAIKGAAENILDAAFQQAHHLAYTARQLPKESRDIVTEALEVDAKQRATLPEKNT